jgi:hypothetical protein
MQGKSPDDFVFTTAARSTSSAPLRWTGGRRPTQGYKKSRLPSSEQLVSYLSPVAARRKSTGLGLANDLFQLAGAAPDGWDP